MKKIFMTPYLRAIVFNHADIVTASEVVGVGAPLENEEDDAAAPARQVSAIDPHIETSNPLPH